ncbi:hypothetical protein GCM10027167_78360 [Nocardia heshunensis]
MRYRPTALGYIRTDVSGISQLWDESQIRRLANRLGYDFSGMVVYDPNSGRPALAQLRAQKTSTPVMPPHRGGICHPPRRTACRERVSGAVVFG